VSAESRRTLSSVIDCATAPGHPLGDENLNPARQSTSELSHPNCRNGHTNQGNLPSTIVPSYAFHNQHFHNEDLCFFLISRS
jgi:hypothetical protein